MQKKSILVLSVLTLGALGIAALTVQRKAAGVTTVERNALFPDFGARINDLTEIRIEKGGKVTLLKKEGGTWRLPERGGYPALVEKVKELAVRVSSLEIEERKTAKKENHKKLAVEWPVTAEEGSEAAEAGFVTFKDAGGKELASLIVGKSEWQGSKPKLYARRASEDQVYLCAPRGSLEIVPDTKSWIEPKFIELANDRVQSVTIQHPDGEKVEVGRSAANHTQFTVQNLEPGQTERYEGVANGVAQALGYGLQLDDVRPVAEVDFQKEPLGVTRFHAVDGLELVLETAKFEDQNWVKITARYNAPPEPAKEPEAEKPVEEGAQTPPSEPAQPEPEKKDIAKEATELNERLAPWAFQVPSYKTDVLLRRMKDLLPEPAEEAAFDDGSTGGLEEALEGMGLEMENESPAPVVEPDANPDDEGAPAPPPAEDEEPK